MEFFFMSSVFVVVIALVWRDDAAEFAEIFPKVFHRLWFRFAQRRLRFSVDLFGNPQNRHSGVGRNPEKQATSRSPGFRLAPE